MNMEEIRFAAGRWFERSQAPNWSAEDQAALDAWLTEDAHKVAYLRIQNFWKRAERLTALRQPTEQHMRAARPSDRNNGSWLRKTAATLVLAALVGVAWQQLNIPKEDTYVTPIGGHKIIAFKDGTSIELNTDTVLRISRNDGERKVWLDKGEAYFEIVHDAARPFIVMANGRKVTDLGTKFAVRQEVGKLSVSVIEGLVEVAAKDEKPQSLLKPGDVLTATKHNQTIIQKPVRNLRASLDWKHGKLFLDYATLSEAAAEFNRYNTRKLVIKDPKAAQLTIVGTFTARDLETFTTVANDLFGLKAEQTKDQIILSH